MNNNNNNIIIHINIYKIFIDHIFVYLHIITLSSNISFCFFISLFIWCYSVWPFKSSIFLECTVQKHLHYHMCITTTTTTTTIIMIFTLGIYRSMVLSKHQLFPYEHNINNIFTWVEFDWFKLSILISINPLKYFLILFLPRGLGCFIPLHLSGTPCEFTHLCLPATKSCHHPSFIISSFFEPPDNPWLLPMVWSSKVLHHVNKASERLPLQRFCLFFL